jgi:Ca2+-transporting ATPase
VATSPSLIPFAWLSVAAAIVTILLKTAAYWITGSVGLLSDAAESLVNLAAAVFALAMLAFAVRPADEGHPFGHGKAEYFSSGFEGALILTAAGGIGWVAWDRLLHPQPLAELDVGMAISVAAGLINLVVALVLLRAGKKYGSITLEADGRHLLTDVWTTAAILLALGGVALTGWLILDPIIAFAAALQICWSGIGLIVRSVSGLLDKALPPEERDRIEGVLDRYRQRGVEFHDLRSRQAGVQRLMTVHVLVPGSLSVKEGHDLLERIEGEIREVVRNIIIVTHLEPLDDPASFEHDRIRQEPPVSSKGGNAQGKTGFPAGRKTAKNVWRRGWRWVGVALLVFGGAISMVTQGIYADVAMGGSLVGLILLLSSRTRSEIR